MATTSDGDADRDGLRVRPSRLEPPPAESGHGAISCDSVTTTAPLAAHPMRWLMHGIGAKVLDVPGHALGSPGEPPG